ncbi:hypothetical protein DFJ73DRAFT_759807 [Zopfochytrium polystomum]|nr:hypothetical protein DFJ73DRAFT_759807 [Zopfochytrium polystomum]
MTASLHSTRVLSRGSKAKENDLLAPRFAQNRHHHRRDSRLSHFDYALLALFGTQSLRSTQAREAARPLHRKTLICLMERPKSLEEQHSLGSGAAYHAIDGRGNAAVYKELHFGEKWRENEIDATKAAGQYVSHDDKSMVQHKVGTQSLPRYLKRQEEQPGWTPNSAEINKQLDEQQKTGYPWRYFKRECPSRHYENNRLGICKPRLLKIIEEACAPKFELVDWEMARIRSISSTCANAVWYSNLPSFPPSPLFSFLPIGLAIQSTQSEQSRLERARAECNSHGFAFRPGRLFRRQGASKLNRSGTKSASKGAGMTAAKVNAKKGTPTTAKSGLKPAAYGKAATRSIGAGVIGGGKAGAKGATKGRTGGGPAKGQGTKLRPARSPVPSEKTSAPATGTKGADKRQRRLHLSMPGVLPQHLVSPSRHDPLASGIRNLFHQTIPCLFKICYFHLE